MNAWAFGTVVLCALIWAGFKLADGVLDRWFRERWHDRWYRSQQAHRPPSYIIDVHSASTRVPFDERTLETAYWGGVAQDAGYREDADSSLG